MKIRIFILLILVLMKTSCDVVDSIRPDERDVFLKFYGGVRVDEAYDFLATDDGGFVIVGRTNEGKESEDDYDVLLIKTDENGNELWKKLLNPADNNGTNSKGSSIIYTHDRNGFIICGETSSSSGMRDVLLVKTDLEGNEPVYQSFDRPGDEYGEDIIQSMAGGYYVLANVEGSKNIFAFDVDEDLNLGKFDYSSPTESPDDEVAFETAKSVIALSATNYLFLGTGKDGDNILVPKGSKNLIVFQKDINGVSFQRHKYIGDFDGTQSDDNASDLVKVNGGYLIVGYIINNNRDTPYIVKVRENDLLSSGPLTNKIWQETYPDILSGDNTPVSAIETNDGGYAILMLSNISQFGDQIGIVKLDEDGKKLWERHLGSQNNDKAGTILQMDNDYFVACGSFSVGQRNDENLLKAGLLKTNPNGDIKSLIK